MTRICLVGLLVVTAALAQPRNYGSPSGFGNILFPGVGTAPPVGSITGYPGFAHRLGTTVGGWPPYTGAPGRRAGQPVYNQGRGNRGRGAAVPYFFPVYVGGWGGYAEEPALQQPPVTVVNQPAPSPPVVINQYYSSSPSSQPAEQPAPSVGVYQAPATPPSPEPARAARQPVQDPKPTIYLIAFRDQTIQPALGYWIEGDTLHYISRSGTLNQASVELVDRAFSRQLNRERNVEFDLP